MFGPSDNATPVPALQVQGSVPGCGPTQSYGRECLSITRNRSLHPSANGCKMQTDGSDGPIHRSQRRPNGNHNDWRSRLNVTTQVISVAGRGGNKRARANPPQECINSHEILTGPLRETRSVLVAETNTRTYIIRPPIASAPSSPHQLHRLSQTMLHVRPDNETTWRLPFLGLGRQLESSRIHLQSQLLLVSHQLTSHPLPLPLTKTEGTEPAWIPLNRWQGLPKNCACYQPLPIF